MRSQESLTTPVEVGVVDVSNLAADDLSQVAQGTDVYLERRGGKTFMIPSN
jgi:hypothetical protein